MKKLLPKTLKNSQGFTLVELMVVISIIAILSVVALVLFSNIQKGARDAKRKADIDAMAKAMEANYLDGTGYQTALATLWFAGGAIPTNPGPGGSTYFQNTPDVNGFTFCAKLENPTGGNSSTNSSFTGAKDQYYCATNSR